MSDFVAETENKICNFLDDNKFVYSKQFVSWGPIKVMSYDLQLNIFVAFPLNFFVRAYFNFSREKIVFSFLDKTAIAAKAVYFDIYDELFSYIESFLFDHSFCIEETFFDEAALSEQMKFDI